MTLLEEKKMVATWMGWDTSYGIPAAYTLPLFDYSTGFFTNECQPFEWVAWNPKSDRNCWDKIWNNMDKHFRPVYITHLGKLLPEYEEDDYNEPWFFHTALPEICWPALIKAIEEL
ncbi:MAG: hypothetical protein GY861_04860 [bacterium]|nr:hypothetical protein [bacterium]